MLTPPRTITFDLEAGLTPEQFADQCEAHRSHHPFPLILEEHHVLPKDWQDEWRPPSSLPKPKLWAPQTIKLCRTGHGNIHKWLERFMKEYERQVDDGVPEGKGAVDFASKIVLAKAKQHHGKEVTIAKAGMYQFLEAGGALLLLCQNKSYGAMYG